MSFFGSVLNVVAPGAGDKFDNAMDDVGEFIDEKIIQPIKDDPVRFIVIAAAYTYGIPGLEFAAAHTAAATGIAAGTYSLAQGKSFDQAVKDGLTTAAFTAAGNYVKKEFFTGVSLADAPGQPTGTVSLDTTADGTGYDSGTVEVGGSSPGTGPQMSTVDAPSYTDPTQPGNPFAQPQPQPSGLEMRGLQDTRLPASSTPPAPAPVNNPVQPGGQQGGPQMNTGQTPNSIYRSPITEPPYVPGSGNMPAEGTPKTYGPDPTRPDLIDPKTGQSPINVSTPASVDFKPEVVDYSRVATPNTTSLSFSNVGDAALAAGEYAYAHPYYTLGGLALASSLGKDDDKDKGGGGNPNKQVGDPRFYQPLEQLQMIQNYDPYKDNIYTYGQAGGEHQFLTSPVYAPVEYADGGPVKMAFGGYTADNFDRANSLKRIVGHPEQFDFKESAPAEVPAGYKYYPQYTAQKEASYDFDPYTYGQSSGENRFFADGGYTGGIDPMQQQYQSPAVGPMMAPQQMPPQQPMGALSQPNVMGYKPSPLTPRTGRPPVPQQPQGRGAPQQIPPQQQNPDYRYFSYGQIPPSVTMPVMQQPQGRATGGLAMAHVDNVPDGRTDNIHSMLSQGEYVMDAETVALLGNGNNDAGAKRLDQMREAVRKQKGGALSKGKISPDAMSPLAYLSGRMA